MRKACTTPKPERRWWQFTLGQLFSFVTGVCLLCGVLSVVAQWSATENLGWALVARLLGVVTVGTLVGAFIADTRQALIGAVAGMVIADLAYPVGLFVDVDPGIFMPDLRVFLFNPLLFVSVFPGAMAGAKNWLVGILAAIVPVLVTVATVAGIGLVVSFLHPPKNEGPPMIMAAVLFLLVPAIWFSVFSWFGARVLIYVVDRLTGATKLWATSLLFFLVAVFSFVVPLAHGAEVIRLTVFGLTGACSLLSAVAAVYWKGRTSKGSQP